MRKNVILYVEDDRAWAKKEIENFQKNGFIVVWAQNKEETLRLYHEKMPDIIILDIRLSSNDDGYWILREIRSKDQQIPILLNTSLVDEITAVKYLHAGGNDFIRKSKITPKEVIAKVSNFIHFNPSNIEQKKKTIITSDTFVDWAKNELVYCGKPEKLPHLETHLLQLLSMNMNMFMDREVIYSQLLIDDKHKNKNQSYINKSLCYLRKKLSKDKKIQIKTEPKNGLGLFIND